MKREIITYLGSNLILNNQKLTIEVKKPLQVISNRPEDFKVINNDYARISKNIGKKKENQ